MTLAAVLAACYLGSTAAPIAATHDAAEHVRLPNDTIAFVHLRVDQLLGSGPLAYVQQQLRAEVLTKMLQEPREALGVDLREVEQLTFGLVFIGPPRVIAPYLHVRTKKPVERRAVLATLPEAQEQEVAGLYARGNDVSGPWDAVRFFDDRSFARGTKASLQLMENSPPSNDLRRRLADALAILDKHHLVAGLAPTAEAKKFFSQLLERNPRHRVDDAIVQMAGQMGLNMESGYATVDLMPQPRFTAQIRFGDERQATRAMRSAHAGVLALQVLVDQVQGNAEMRELSKVLEGFSAALDNAQIVQKGTDVSMLLEVKLAEGQLNRALLEAVLRVQGGMRGMARANNLRTILVAMHNYHSDFNRMPGNFCDAQGKPILSWRVALLPYMEQEGLFRQFKTDEPWDSPNNKPLIAQMPKYFQVPGANTPAGQTHLQVFTAAPNYNGRYMPIFHFGPLNRQRSLGQISSMDGTSNTFCVVEATQPVIWTKPDDLMIDAAIEDLNKPSPALGAIPDDPYFYVAFTDASVRSLRRSLPDAAKYKRILRTYIGVADGEIEDLSPLESGGSSSRTTFRSVGDRIEVSPPKATVPPPEAPKRQDP